MRNVILATLLILCGMNAWSVSVVAFPGFGHVHIYSGSGDPQNLILFVSGDGGWNIGEEKKARVLTSIHDVVVGIDINEYMKRLNSSGAACSYPVENFEDLSRAIEKRLQLRKDLPTVLLGYSDGATLVYATLAEAPPHTFAGAVSMGFCPDMALAKPLCKGEGLQSEPYATKKEKGYVFQPFKELKDPWLVFQGDDDQVCSVTGADEYVKQVPNARVIDLPKVGHGFHVSDNWVPQFQQAFQEFNHPAQRIPPQ